ncbi:peroxide stress protein YaaA [Aliiroseovarius subalbicans]|uniref:peroxide stress protein YaaA n=1 Tax=Aliiroseovarius subalbicans TaxID=2925840 RepID=UPI001F5A5934|nr:peroxide stress protein YaaA [Aliiroseovarius subalbicans]MCI2399784.1 peroxide stress protein YaaA [Aliiroseovarius subalbicans]
MLVVVSPAKRLDETPPRDGMGTTPVFLDQAGILAETASALSSAQLEKLMHISPKLGALNVERFAAFGSGQGEKPALEMFAGDTYAGLDAGSLEPDELAYAQDHLRMLSGLYGLLRPRDLIAPHRLEMGSRLKNSRGKNLYEFWSDQVALALNAQAAKVGTDTLVNCASVEYFSAVDPAALSLRVITPTFLEERNGTAKVVSFFAKKARGSLARFMIQRRITNPEGLKDFDLGGYRFRGDLSEGDNWVFLRDYPDPA